MAGLELIKNEMMNIEVPLSIATIESKLESGDTTELRMVFLSEEIFSDRSHSVVSPPIPLTIENLKRIKEDPFICYQNVVFNNPQETENELFHLMNDPKKMVSEGETKPILLIVDSTREENGKSLENLLELEKVSKTTRVVRSFLPFKEFIKEMNSQDQKVYSDYFNTEKLEINFFFDKKTPGIVGPLSFWNIESYPNSNEAAVLGSVLSFSKKYRCPVIIDLSNSHFERAEKYLREPSKEIVLTGLVPRVVSEWKYQDDKQTIEKKISIDLKDLICALKAGFTVNLKVFEMKRCGIDLRGMALVIGSLLRSVPGSEALLVLGIGLVHKTDFLKFGGDGMKVVNELVGILKDEGIESSVIDKIIRENAQGLLTWWRPLKVQVKVNLEWKCDECGKSFSEDKPKISKMDFTFCSPPCFKLGLKKINNK